MALQYADRIKQVTSNTSGTVTLTLSSVVQTGFNGFVAGIGNGNTCHYCLEDANGSAWEVGVGTVTDAALDTLSRDTVLASSNGTTRINLTTGVHTVFCTYPAQAAYNSNPLYDTPAIAAGSLTINLRSASDSVHRVTLNQNIIAGGITLINPPAGLARVHIQFEQATPGGTTYDVPATAWPVNMVFTTLYQVYPDATPTVIRAVTLDGGTNYIAENNYEPTDYQPLDDTLSQLSTLTGSGLLSLTAGSLSTASATGLPGGTGLVQVTAGSPSTLSTATYQPSATLLNYVSTLTGTGVLSLSGGAITTATVTGGPGGTPSGMVIVAASALNANMTCYFTASSTL